MQQQALVRSNSAACEHRRTGCVLQGELSVMARALERERGGALAAREKADAAMQQLHATEMHYMQLVEALDKELKACRVRDNAWPCPDVCRPPARTQHVRSAVVLPCARAQVKRWEAGTTSSSAALIQPAAPASGGLPLHPAEWGLRVAAAPDAATSSSSGGDDEAEARAREISVSLDAGEQEEEDEEDGLLPEVAALLSLRPLL